MWKQQWLCSGIAMLSMIALPEIVKACQCVGRASACEDYGRPGAIFLGTVAAVLPKSLKDVIKQGAPYRWRVQFDLKEAFKGVTAPSIEVSTGLGMGDCGFPFRPGHSYLVYAYFSKEGDRHLETGICTRTVDARSEEHTSELQSLRHLVC